MSKHKNVYEITFVTDRELTIEERNQMLRILKFRGEGYHVEIPENLTGGEMSIRHVTQIKIDNKKT